MFKALLLGASGTGMLIGGIFVMRYGLKQLLWRKFQQVLLHMTKTPLHGFLTGAVASALMQGSTAVSLLVIGFVSADYLSFYQGLGIILGANVGTCSTVQLMTVSFPEHIFAPLLFVSIAGSIFFKKIRNICLVASGLFGMFAGLSLLSGTLSSLTEINTIITYIEIAKTNVWSGIAGGILMTVLFQSSSAATGMLMILAGSGFIDLSTAAYVVYGNNIGACISSLVIGLAAPLAARRIAISHLLLNILGVIAFLPATALLIKTTAWFSGDFSVQIALFHTIFNIISSLAVLPFLKLYARLIIFLVPGKNR
jgi:phosphate:Na+ symporter